MQVTVTTLGDLLFALEVAEDMELENFKALCEAESGIRPDQMVVMHNGKALLEDKKPLKEYGVAENDVLLLQKMPQSSSSTNRPSTVPSSAGGNTSSLNLPDFSQIQVPQAGGRSPEDDPVFIRDMFLSNPRQLAQLKQTNPQLAEALITSLEEFKRVFDLQRKSTEEQKRLRLRMLTADPFDPEAQRLIAEEIRRQNIDTNIETAMEYHPESYGTVTMLYINCKVNGHPVKAFVDSGAQSTIMSMQCAERCNITRLIDSRWSGIAKGVGTQRIVGRIHLCQVQIENDFLASSFTILEHQPMDMLLGLDMLKRHQCSIDLRRNLLSIGTSGTETRFLDESQLPEFAKHKAEDMESDDQLTQAINESSRESSVSGHSDATIKSLTDMGFGRQQVIQELSRFNGDQEKALAALLAKSISVPSNNK